MAGMSRPGVWGGALALAAPVLAACGTTSVPTHVAGCKNETGRVLARSQTQELVFRGSWLVVCDEAGSRYLRPTSRSDRIQEGAISGRYAAISGATTDIELEHDTYV